MPLMVHIGERDDSLRGSMETFSALLLPLLEKGDILTHVFTGQAGAVIRQDGTVVPGLREAMARGDFDNLPGHGKPQ